MGWRVFTGVTALTTRMPGGQGAGRQEALASMGRLGGVAGVQHTVTGWTALMLRIAVGAGQRGRSAARGNGKLRTVGWGGGSAAGGERDKISDEEDAGGAGVARAQGGRRHW